MTGAPPPAPPAAPVPPVPVAPLPPDPVAPAAPLPLLLCVPPPVAVVPGPPASLSSPHAATAASTRKGTARRMLLERIDNRWFMARLAGRAPAPAVGERRRWGGAPRPACRRRGLHPGDRQRSR